MVRGEAAPGRYEIAESPRREYLKNALFGAMDSREPVHFFTRQVNYVFVKLSKLEVDDSGSQYKFAGITTNVNDVQTAMAVEGEFRWPGGFGTLDLRMVVE